MTHANPTIAPKTPPPRGEAMGVRDRPRGPCRVRYSAPLLTLLLATPALAQVIPTGSPAADILLSQAIAENRVFLTCSALDPATHAQILSNWQRDTAAAVAILKTHNVPPEAITAFTTAADPAALMPADDTPWGDVRQLCDTHPTWAKDYQDAKLTRLATRLPQVLP